jgi:pimeloyl-ACP methyl ester carboxylesterase
VVRARIVGAAAVAAAVLGIAAPAEGRIVQGKCTAKALKGAECGTFPVPLDHANPSGPAIDMAYALYSARKGSQGTVVIIPGGPGQAAIPSAGALAKGPLAVLRDRYDLMFADPRGTGRSAPLRCEAAPKGVFKSQAGKPADFARAVARCGEEIGERRRFFTTTDQVLDLEDLRNFLEVDKLIPVGISYGGEVAGAYARRFPDRVQALVLDSTSPIEGADPLGKLPSLALPRVLRDTCFPPGCEGILGDPVVQLERAVARLRSGPLRGEVALPDGRRRVAAIGQSDLYRLILSSDVDPLIRSELPSAMQAAARGDAAPLLRMLVRPSGGGGSSDVNDVRFLATECTEGRLPWAPTSDPATRPALLREAVQADAGAYAPFGIGAVIDQVPAALCLGWPATPGGDPTPNNTNGPDVPVLVLGGRLDLRTPLEDQRRAASQFPSATVVAVPEVGHSVITTDRSNCVRVTLRAFLAGRSVGPCTRRAEAFPLALPVFRRLSEVPAASVTGDAPARTKRTLVAVDLTLRDVSRQLIVQFEGIVGDALAGRALSIPGLRGGRAVLGRQGVTLQRYELVEGVRVSGTLPDTNAGTITVTGSGATGSLTLSTDGVLTGTLGGAKIRYRFRDLPGLA